MPGAYHSDDHARGYCTLGTDQVHGLALAKVACRSLAGFVADEVTRQAISKGVVPAS